MKTQNIILYFFNLFVIFYCKPSNPLSAHAFRHRSAVRLPIVRWSSAQVQVRSRSMHHPQASPFPNARGPVGVMVDISVPNFSELCI